MATPIYSGGTRQPIHTPQPQVQKSWVERIKISLGLTPQPRPKVVMNTRDVYNSRSTYDRSVVNGLAKLGAGRMTPKSATPPKNQLDPLLLDFCSQISKNGIS